MMRSGRKTQGSQESDDGMHVGLGMATFSGPSAAWTQAFADDHFDAKRAGHIGRSDSHDDLFDDIDEELLNPSVDEKSWIEPWYIEKIPNSRVNQALDGKPDGAFLIRDSASQPGCFALSYRYLGLTHHALISRSKGGIHLAKSPHIFSCLSDLVDHYKGNSHVGNGDLPCPLRPEIDLGLEDMMKIGRPFQTNAPMLDSSYVAMYHSGADDNKVPVINENGVIGHNNIIPNPVVPSRDTKPSHIATKGVYRAKPPPPPPPSKQQKQLAKSQPGSNDNTSFNIQGDEQSNKLPSVILCPHCSARQSLANMVCAVCSKRLASDSRRKRRNSSMVYTVPDAGTLLGKVDIPDDYSVSSPSTDEEMEQTDHTVPAGNFVANTEQPDSSNYEHMNERKDKRGQSKQGREKPKTKKRGKSVEVIVDSPPESLKSILLSSSTDFRKRRNIRVSFDEQNISNIFSEFALLRGASKRVDDLAWDCGYYFDEDMTPRQAKSKLRGTPRGTFLVYPHIECIDKLIISIAQSENQVQHRIITQSCEGLQLDEQGPVFEFLSGLVAYYSGDNTDFPHLLRLSPEQQHVISTNKKDEQVDTSKKSVGCNQSNDNEVDVETRSSEDTPSHQNSMVPCLEQLEAQHYPILISARQIEEEQWYHGELSRPEAVAFIEFEPSGSFVVRKNYDEEGWFVLTYVYNGDVYHTEIKPYGDGFSLSVEDAIVRPNIVSLIEFYASVAGKSTGHLAAQLRLPRSRVNPHSSSDQQEHRTYSPLLHVLSAQALPDLKPSPSSNQSPGWLNPNMSKLEASKYLANQDSGCFVVRKSNSRKDCFVLSYKYKQHVNHELIKQTNETPPHYYLVKEKKQMFASLVELVQYFEQPTDTLKCILVSDSAHEPNREKPISPIPLRRGSSQHNLFAPTFADLSQLKANALPRDQNTTSMVTEFQQASSQPQDFPPQVREEGQAKLSPTPSRRRSRLRGSMQLVRGGERLDHRAATSSWCCLNLNKHQALTQIPTQEGAFIICRSENHFATLILISDGKHRSFEIEDTTQGLHLIKSKLFHPNLSALVAYYKIPTQSDLPRCLLAW